VPDLPPSQPRRNRAARLRCRPPPQRSAIDKALNDASGQVTITRALFVSAQKEVFRVMEMDSFERFKHTEAWERFLYGADDDLVHVVPASTGINSPGRARRASAESASSWFAQGMRSMGLGRWLGGNGPSTSERLSLNRDAL